MANVTTLTQVGTPAVRISRTTIHNVDTAWNAATLTFASLQTAVGGSGGGNIVVTAPDGTVTTIASGDAGGTLATKIAALDGVLYNIRNVGRAAAHTL